MKKYLFVMLMGVFTLQSCTIYRIKVVKNGSTNYYFPQKRVLYSWEDMDQLVGYDLESAKKTIDLDRESKIKNHTYIKY